MALAMLSVQSYLSRPLVAQSAPVIDAALVSRHLDTIASRSMHGRMTPSQGLDSVAQYIADEFRRLQLKPGREGLAQNGQSERWALRYALPGTPLVYAASRVEFQAEVPEASNASVKKDRPNRPQWKQRLPLDFTTNVRPARFVGQARSFVENAGLVILAGPYTVSSVQSVNVDPDANIVYIPPTGGDSSVQEAIIDALLAARLGRGVFILADEDSSTFARRRDDALQRPFMLTTDYRQRGMLGTIGWAVYVWPPALNDFLHDVAGVDLADLRATTTPVVRHLPNMRAGLKATLDSLRYPSMTAPNVIGILEGRDSVLRNEHIVILAHMDAGTTDQRVPTVGGDLADHDVPDNAVGVAGLMALAHAFRQLPTPPRRSIAFVAVSGSVSPGFWGSTDFANSWQVRYVALGIGLDLLGSLDGDSLVVDGIDDVELARPLAWVAEAHPDLKVRFVAGHEVARPHASLFALVRRGTPGLYLSTEAPSASKPAQDRLTSANTSRAANMLELVFHLARDIADAREKPRWTSLGRFRFMTMVGR